MEEKDWCYHVILLPLKFPPDVLHGTYIPYLVKFFCFFVESVRFELLARSCGRILIAKLIRIFEEVLGLRRARVDSSVLCLRVAACEGLLIGTILSGVGHKVPHPPHGYRHRRRLHRYTRCLVQPIAWHLLCIFHLQFPSPPPIPRNNPIKREKLSLLLIPSINISLCGFAVSRSRALPLLALLRFRDISRHPVRGS